MRGKLHLVFDPLCGWCYAMKPFLYECRFHFGSDLQMEFHPGLLFSEPTDIALAYREHMRSSDNKIAALTGVQFGDAYFRKLETAPILRYHSAPPSAAIMSFRHYSAGNILGMLEKIQHAHYVDGADVGDLAVLIRLAEELGIDKKDFLDRYAVAKVSLPARASQAHQLLKQVGAHGFPSLILEVDGVFKSINHTLAYGDPQQVINLISRQM